MSAKGIAVRLGVIAAVLVTLLAGGYVLAAGREIGDDDRREARAVVARYLDAYARHDGAAICAELTADHRSVIAEGRPGGCARHLARLSRIEEVVPSGRPRVRLIADGDRGDGITAVLDYADGSGTSVLLRDVDGRWRVDSDQTCVTPSCRP